jgi:diguanylate cyclase (GGDEF)-like protein
VSFEVDSAFQGRDAVELVRAAREHGLPYSVAFVDGRMPPGISGLETIERVWEVDPRVQIVISSAYSDHTFSEIVATLGHRDGLLVLRKPFDSIEVLQLTHALARKWALAREVENRLDELESTVKRRTSALEATNAELLRQAVERMRVEQELRKLATHDPVTGIPNRVLFRERTIEALSRARRRAEILALMLLDLDHFKDVNDNFGHPTGDKLLQGVAERLRTCVRNSDVVARLGGDEFAILLEGFEFPEEAGIIAERIQRVCAAPFVIENHEVRISTSIGIAISPDNGHDVDELLKTADLALYGAKDEGRGTTRFYSQDLSKASHEQLAMREDLAFAVERDELRLHYQPLMDIDTGAVVAMEALVRWQHPTRGLVPPIKFIPAAEKNGMILTIGRWVLETACRQLAEWKRQGISGVEIAVNVSAREVREPDFVDFVLATVQKAGLEPCDLELELTESAAMKRPEDSAEALGRLSAAGVRLAIDDFGSGYSSLMRLKQMPINVLKIDRFFVRDLETSPRAAAIVRAAVAMAHSLGLTVVVEGIETQEQLDALKNLEWDREVPLKCHRVQGYLLSKPLTPENATTLLAQRDRELELTGS